ncbi:MAG: hypothetical protein WA151_11385 [Desulfatirhabdiaceae bacterium]
MASDYQRDREYADRFILKMSAYLGMCFFKEAPAKEDMEHNTDLVVLNMGALRIACRLRKFGMLARYGDEFTIRASRPSGIKTELDKVMAGWGDYFFYGFANEHDTDIAKWTVIDLTAFRSWCHGYIVAHSGEFPGEFKNNADGSSGFRAFCFADLPADVVFRSSVDFLTQEEIEVEVAERRKRETEKRAWMDELNQSWKKSS